MWLSAAVAHLLRGDAGLHTLVVLPLPSCQVEADISLWSLASTRHFGPENSHLLGVFSLLDHSLWTLEIVVWETPSRSAVSEILRPGRLAPPTVPCLKSFKSPSFPILRLCDLHLFVLIISTCLNTLGCCHVICWLDDDDNEPPNRRVVSNKVASACIYAHLWSPSYKLERNASMWMCLLTPKGLYSNLISSVHFSHLLCFCSIYSKPNQRE